MLLNAVPQGSVLWPFLCIPYVNDIDSIFSESIIFKLFADDLKFTVRWTLFYHRRLQEAINSVVARSVTWQLPINFCKYSSCDIELITHFIAYYLNRLGVPVSNSPRDLVLNLIPCSGSIIISMLFHLSHNLE